MTENLAEPTIGQIVTPITWDGTDFHPPMSTVAGLLQVSVEEATEIVTRCMGYDGGAWVAMHVDAAGDVQADILTIAEGEIRCYGKSGAGWQPVALTVLGEMLSYVTTIDTGEIKNYVYNGAAWVPQLEVAGGITQVDVDSLRGHNDVIPMHYHSQWGERVAFAVTAGQNYVQSSVVPAGYVGVVTHISFVSNNAATPSLEVAIHGSGFVAELFSDMAPTAWGWSFWDGELHLVEDDFVRLAAYGTPVGTVLILVVLGYYMRIP